MDFLAVACPSASECVAVDSAGGEVTFDPAAPGAPTLVMVDPGTGLRAVACPTPSLCGAIDSQAREVTFDPAAPGAPAPVAIDATRSVASISCPSASECVAVNGKGAEVTFNPASPGAPAPAAVDPAGGSLYGVACPSVSECVAVDSTQGTGFLSGLFGAEVTFNPLDPGTPAPALVDRVGPVLVAVACPSATLCAAVDPSGWVVSFDPLAASISTVVPVQSGAAPLSVGCVSAGECVAVDSVGNAFLGDPRTASAWAVAPIDSPNPLTGVACAAPGECVAVDHQGHVFVGVAAPVGGTPPTISGSAAQGKTLTAAPGAWSPTPAAYAYQWQRCDAAGAGCAPIPGATGRTFALTAADVGSSIRVQVTASDAAGAGAPATSAPTAVVTVAPAGGGSTGSPRVTGFRVTRNPFRVGRAVTPISASAAVRGFGHKAGTVFEYSLSEASTVRIAIFQRLAGRRGGGRCVAPAGNPGRGRPCTRLVARGTLIRASRRGANRVAFSGRIGVRALTPGRYQARLTATDAAKRASRPVSISFAVVSG